MAGRRSAAKIRPGRRMAIGTRPVAGWAGHPGCAGEKRELVLRIHFTTTDLNRVQWATHPEPLMETILSLQLLQQPEAHSRPFARWSSQVGQALGRRESLLLDLATPDEGTWTELLTSPARATSLEGGLAAVTARPRARAIADLAVARSLRPDLPGWVVDLHHHRSEAIAQFTSLLHTYHRLAIAPAWSHVQHAIHTAYDRAAATPEAALADLHPRISWQYPILTVPCHIPHDVDVHLAGRGLLLIPAFFLRTPTARLDNHDEQAPLELYFPIHHRNDSATEDSHHPEPSLVGLLGRTRATILTALTTSRSTTDLAARVSTSPATTSHHLNALRAANLITTTRHHGGTQHHLTHLGIRLLHAAPHAAGEPVTALPAPASP